MYPMQFSKIETAGTAEIVGIYEKVGGRAWSRTRDLVLIRDAL